MSKRRQMKKKKQKIDDAAILQGYRECEYVQYALVL